MRIISGSLKGRALSGYDIDGTRPTMDKVKESIFSMIQFELDGRNTLDLFAGSGSLGFEAISNGASKCTFVDKNIKCINVIKKDIELFKLNNCDVLLMDYKKAINYFNTNSICFDLVLLDPPYKMFIINDILDELIKKNILCDNCLLVCEMENNFEISSNTKLELIKEKNYGPKHVIIYKYKK